MNSAVDTDWEAKYQTGDTPWDKGEPSPGLVDFLASRPRGTQRSEWVLVPGCGYGHDARVWGEAGFQVVGYDLSESAVKGARIRGAKHPQVVFERGDFLVDRPKRQYDWVFEHTCFCAIHPTRRADYVSAVERWLKPGGHYLAVQYFLPVDEAGPPFGVDRDEILGRYTPGFELIGEWVPRSYPNRVGLERMFWWRRR